MEIVLRKILNLQYWLRMPRSKSSHFSFLFLHAYITNRIKNIGITAQMGDYEKRKLRIFNLLNFLQFCFGILIPIWGMSHADKLPVHAWKLAFLPAFTSLLVLLLNYLKHHEWSRLIYFILYPFLTCIVYLNGMDTGVTLHFILFGVLSVFFLKDIGYMLFTVGLSMVSYFILAVVLEHFIYEVRIENHTLYLVNEGLALTFIFYGLYLVKRENTSFQYRIIRKNKILYKKNLEIQEQNEVIAQQVKTLDEQKLVLTDLNNLKNKLFSVIAHDLKSPVYAIRNLIQNMYRQDIPAADMKKMLPEVVNDLNYTIGLMDNMLHWAKSQMTSATVKKEKIDIDELIYEMMNLFSLQAEAKQVYLDYAGTGPVYAWADKEMIRLVLRNLVSNAIKFTSVNGVVSLGVHDQETFVEIFVQDTGTGMSKETLKKINDNNFYTTKGTASEPGTGLGLMLCREFLQKNEGKMFIESEAGKGSTFSFTLPVS
jgi:signal transduction histidine kinase